MGTIVVGYVPKPEGQAALRTSVSEAKLRGSRLIVVNSNRGGRDMDDDDSVRSQAQLSEIDAELADTGIEYEVRQFVRGLEPAEDLIEIADEAGAELIVIGLRRRTPLGKLILGSNAQQVLLDATCPVLAVKA
ncbi:MAG TPA: universal stress protein [Marmoricola sp.]|nr:universal stress protein [Marmoricola sp.]